MTERPPPYRPHLWVPYYGTDQAEIYTLCGDFQTPETCEQACPESFLDMPDELPGMASSDVLAETADGTDDEQQRGITKPL